MRQKKIAGMLDFIGNFAHFFSEYSARKLASPPALELLERIMDSSGKQAEEAVLILLYAIKYISGDGRALEKLETSDGFDDFLLRHREELFLLGRDKKVQYNLMERGLPVLEILGRKCAGEKIAVIELGSSYGLIGTCLCSNNILLAQRGRFFATGQQLPVRPQGVAEYLGIDLDPPDAEWVLACTDSPEEAERIRRALADQRIADRMRIARASMIGFSGLPEVRHIAQSGRRVVVLTSFVLYQFEEKTRKQIAAEIAGFLKPLAGLWIDQFVDTRGAAKEDRYFISLNGKKIIRLADDRCSAWAWMDG